MYLKAKSCALILLVFVGCSSPAGTAFTPIEGADKIAFRCVLDQAGVLLNGAPLENCGCLKPLGDEASEGFEVLPRLRCTCTGPDGLPVEYVQGECQGEVCVPVVVDGDYVAWDGSSEPAQCVPEGGGELRGYVTSSTLGEVTPIRVARAPGRRGASAKDVVDVDRTIPGLNGIFIDDIVTAIVADPLGRFLVTVNSSSGSLSVIASDSSIREEARIELNLGPLYSAVVFPDPRNSPRVQQNTDLPRRLYVTAPGSHAIAVIDLDRLWASARDGALTEADPLIDCFGLSPNSDCGWLGGSADNGGIPGPIALDLIGEMIVVGFRERPAGAFMNRIDGATYSEFDLQNVRPCKDSYRSPALSENAGADACADGLDNDGDGFADDADSDCELKHFEGDSCLQAVPCADGWDNDADGLTDADDPDCSQGEGFWEQSTIPACADGEDNDGDGLVDRFDPGCANLTDGNEGDRELGPACENGLDDDGDGLADDEDPGCRTDDSEARSALEKVPQCADGIDNDGDGLADYGLDGDPGCQSASDPEEGANQATAGIDSLALVDVSSPSGSVQVAYLSSDGALYALEFTGDKPRLSSVDAFKAVVGMTPRQWQGKTQLLLADGAGVISSLTPGEYRALTYGEYQQPIFARSPGLRYDDPDAWTRLRLGLGTFLDGSYIVSEGRAIPLDEGDGLCRVLTCGDETDCGGWSECVSGVCVPRACAESVDCGNGGICSADGVCIRACESHVDCPSSLRCAPETSERPQSCRSKCEASDFGGILVGDHRVSDFPTSTEGVGETFELLDNGGVDTFLASSTEWDLKHQEANRFVSAFARSPRMSGSPVLSVRGARKQLDVDRYPFFCDIRDESDTCIPPGYKIEADMLTPLEDGETKDVGAGWLTTVGEIAVKEAARELGSDSFALTFEGVIPGSGSSTGHFGESSVENEWRLLDFRANFCALGIEENDVVLVERFSPEEADNTACEIFEGDEEAFSSVPLRERIRYVVTAVSAHGLSLVPDVREAFNQRPRSPFVSIPKLAPPVPSPTRECVSRPIEYSVRVGHDQWLLEGQASGFPHPWFSEDGQCLRHPGRIDVLGRARLGTPFENRWLKFALGSTSGEGLCVDTETCDPYMVDVSYTFSLGATTSFNRYNGGLRLPRTLSWLPNLDRLFVVDSGLETVLELGGLDPLLESIFEVTRYR